MGCNLEAKDTALHKNGIWQVVAQFVCLRPPIEDIMCDISALNPEKSSFYWSLVAVTSRRESECEEGGQRVRQNISKHGIK